MRVLVVTASKHGSTEEIGRFIAETLTGAGVDARILAPDEVTSLDGFDAAVLGSAVYAGRWMRPMREMVDRLAAELGERPVWLFSSGPIGDPPKPDEDPVDVAPIMEATGAQEHILFAGKLDKKALGFGERAIVGALKAPEGDFRDWDEIATWVSGVAEVLKAKV